jgi:hypothetical protein
VVQGKGHSPHKANGYHGVVPMAVVVGSLQGKVQFPHKANYHGVVPMAVVVGSLQGKVQFPHKANDYHNVVPRAGVVVSLQEKVQFPHKANGHHGVVPTAVVVVSFRDKMNKLKSKASAHQLLKKKTETEYPAGPDGHYKCWARAGPAGRTVRTVGGDSGRGRVSDMDNLGCS